MFQDLFGHYSQQHLQFRSLFPAIVYIWDRLQAVVDSLETIFPTMLKDMKVFMRLVQKHELLRDYFSSQRTTNRHAPIEYDDLWILFLEGQLFYGSPADLPQAFLAVGWDYVSKEDKKKEDDHFHVFCWSHGRLLGNGTICDFRD